MIREFLNDEIAGSVEREYLGTWVIKEEEALQIRRKMKEEGKKMGGLSFRSKKEERIGWKARDFNSSFPELRMVGKKGLTKVYLAFQGGYRLLGIGWGNSEFLWLFNPGKMWGHFGDFRGGIQGGIFPPIDPKDCEDLIVEGINWGISMGCFPIWVGWGELRVCGCPTFVWLDVFSPQNVWGRSSQGFVLLSFLRDFREIKGNKEVFSKFRGDRALGFRRTYQEEGRTNFIDRGFDECCSREGGILGFLEKLNPIVFKGVSLGKSFWNGGLLWTQKGTLCTGGF